MTKYVFLSSKFTVLKLNSSVYQLPNKFIHKLIFLNLHIIKLASDNQFPDPQSENHVRSSYEF